MGFGQMDKDFDKIRKLSFGVVYVALALKAAFLIALVWGAIRFGPPLVEWIKDVVEGG